MAEASPGKLARRKSVHGTLTASEDAGGAGRRRSVVKGLASSSCSSSNDPKPSNGARRKSCTDLPPQLASEASTPSPGGVKTPGRRKSMSKPGGAWGGAARKAVAAKQAAAAAAQEEEVRKLRASAELKVVLDDWWELTRQGGMLSKDRFAVLCRKTYKAIGDADGHVLHPGSDRAKESAQADWEASVGLLRTRTDLSRELFESALIRRCLLWVHSNGLTSSAASCDAMLREVLDVVALRHPNGLSNGTPLDANGRQAAIGTQGRWLSKEDFICGGGAHRLLARASRCAALATVH